MSTDSGAEHRTARWTDALRQYNARYGVRDQNDLSAVMEFYLAREGALGSFRFKDWGEQVRVRIRDTGPGMSEEVKSNIFEAFYTTKAVGEGTGLGLSISQGIIEKHHGSIEVESEIGKGTTFTISLPVKQPETG